MTTPRCFKIMRVLVFAIALQLCHSSPPPSAAEGVPRCRTERREALPYEQYRRDVCARCYRYMPDGLFEHKFRYDSLSGDLRDLRTNTSYTADPYNSSRALVDTFRDSLLLHKWRVCCEAALVCCDRMSRKSPTVAGVHCPRTWDGWQCWEDTPAGTTATQPCQDHIYFQPSAPSCTGYVRKECLQNGTWYIIPGTYREWTNYTGCAQREYHRRNLYFHTAMYVATILALLPALTIFATYKQLHVHRISMHKNLFTSLLLHGVCVVLLKCTVVFPELNRYSLEHPSVLKENGPWCKALLVLTKYFRMTNYLWMFCEGYYLHKLIASAFAEQKTLRMFYAIGWGCPLIPVSIYAILRATLQNEKCWAFPVEQYEWIMNVPNLVSLCANLFFLCNIIRVLVTKLRTTHANEPSQYRKAVRATLVMMPLFGLHFCLTIYRPSSGKCGLYEAYVYFDHALDGLQGFMVAVIFCYLNGEVIYLLKRSYQRFKLHLQIMRNSHHIQQGEKIRKWSATQETSIDSHNHHHHHHFHRIRHVENKLREINVQVEVTDSPRKDLEV